MYYKFTSDDGSEAYLAHYGVLGMRWGVRHDKQYKSEKAAIKSSGKDKASQKAALNEAKVKAANRLYSTNSEEANRRIQTRSTAKTIGATALLGSYGMLHYDRAVAEHGKKGQAVARGLMASYVNNYTMGAAGIHNYLVDRRGRSNKETSKDTNRRYVHLKG